MWEGGRGKIMTNRRGGGGKVEVEEGRMERSE